MIYEIEFFNSNDINNMHDYHTHPFWELYILIDGARDYYIANKAFKIGSNSAVLIPPYVPHKTEGGTFTRYLISFSSDCLSTELLSLLLSKGYFVLDLYPLKIENIKKQLTFLMEEYELRQNYWQEVSINSISSFIYLIMRSSTLKEHTALFPSSTNICRTITNIKNYILNNLDEKLSLKSLSERFYISTCYLSRAFHKAENQTLENFITLARATKAKELLKTTPLSMEKISVQCGLGSANNMNRVFNRVIGISPSKYKKYFI